MELGSKVRQQLASSFNFDVAFLFRSTSVSIAERKTKLHRLAFSLGLASLLQDATFHGVPSDVSLNSIERESTEEREEGNKKKRKKTLHAQTQLAKRHEDTMFASIASKTKYLLDDRHRYLLVTMGACVGKKSAKYANDEHGQYDAPQSFPSNKQGQPHRSLVDLSMSHRSV